MQSTICIPTLKRSACDRCRKHKLRCSIINEEPCTRCRRASAQCVVGYVRPRGWQRSLEPAHKAASPQNSTFEAMITDSTAPTTPTQDWIACAPGTMDQGLWDPWHGELGVNGDAVGVIHALSVDHGPGVSSPVDNAGPAKESGGADGMLCKLSLDLCRETQRLRGGLEARETASIHAFGLALGYTGEYIGILKSSRGGGLACQLDIASCYVRILGLFEMLIGSLVQDSEEGILGCGKDGFLPGVKLAGFEVEEGRLQLKLLVHTIMHQFESMETLLALPAELKIAGKQEDRDTSTDGVFGGLLNYYNGTGRNMDGESRTLVKRVESLKAGLGNLMKLH
ncbi:hypothetical protein PgNI_06554 [Pyricularia grisea]|uniref:Zn(2)-C6 fungal-type domain-containing protein n=1 Tax=Pyricularia grisea TaxID=148305 RepID=A0A6P8B6L1_PYRGI|nr:hypothetical protein PgNI_06554 [Pyricularia grisea]TLD10905.1 hypothetical protein PgNI_06554 [Pyricularia grisea]